MTDKDPQLEPPGAGLPFPDNLVVRWMIFPITTKIMSKNQAIKRLLETGHKCLHIIKSLNQEQQRTRTLIPRIRGIEDSSRFWSPLMVIEHLIITSEAMAGITKTLNAGEKVPYQVRIEDVKPHQDLNARDILDRYEAFLNTYEAQMTPLINLDNPAHKHAHPWMGAITAHQWLCLNAMHHNIHLNQLNEIVKRL